MVNHIEWKSLEQVARALGQRWARRVRTDGVHRQCMPSHWPYTIDDARELVDKTFGARLEGERSENVARTLDRSARAAWDRSTPELFGAHR
jgi:hypothetical protein